MNRTIIFFTNGESIQALNGSLDESTTDENLKEMLTIYSTSDCAIYALPDDEEVAVGLYEQFRTKHKMDDLVHIVYHTKPEQTVVYGFREQLLKANSALRRAAAYNAMHELDVNVAQGIPYRKLAALLLKQKNREQVSQEDFEDLWRVLEGDPILEDLITLLRAHALEKAKGAEIGTADGVKELDSFKGMGKDAQAIMGEKLESASTCGSVREALLAAVVERDANNRERT